MAQVILTRRLAARGVGMEVGSAGLLPGGAPLPVETEDALAALGFTPPVLPAFVSAQVSPEALAVAELVLGMTREHVREVAVAVPQVWDRSFTLKELVRRGTEAGGRTDGEALAAWLARVGVERTRTELLGSSPDDDVVDPIGGRPADFVRTAKEIDELCGELVALAWP
jgi:protein-tyrosine phosphatase